MKKILKTTHNISTKIWGRKDNIIALITLGIPLIIGQIGAIAQQFADTIMVGQYGTTELAAAGLVTNIFNFVIFSILGISYATTPVVGAAYGRGDKEGVARSFVESIVVNLLVSLFIVACLMLLYYNIGILQQPEEIMPVAKPYFLILTASVPFMALFNAMKQFSDAVGETRVPMCAMLTANVANIFLNWCLIFGHCGMPEMGLMGAGIATFSSRVICMAMMAGALLFMRKYRSLLPTLRTMCSASFKGMKHIFLLGVPISIQLGLESSSFNVCAIMMGMIGAIPLAAHQVMCTVATLCFQVVYGLGAAASVLVSQNRGMGNLLRIRSIARSAFAMGFTAVIIITTLVVVFSEELLGCFTTSEAVIAVCISFIPCFILYQFGDCMQIVYANALRGIECVSKMMLYAFIAYYVVSLPLSYFFGFIMKLGAVGIWMGFPFGLTTAGLLFFWEFQKMTYVRKQKLSTATN